MQTTSEHMDLPSVGGTPSLKTVEARGASDVWRTLPPPQPAQAARRFLHVVQQGATVLRQSERVRVVKDQRVLADVPVDELDGVVLYGSVQLTTQAIAVLTEAGVWVSFHTRHGRFRGRLQPAAPRTAMLRALQRERSADPEWRFASARASVRGKLLGMIATARSYLRNYGDERVREGVDALQAALGRLPGTTGVQALRGIEGSASRAWFEVLRVLNRSGLAFDQRVQRYAPDPINSLLNLAYTMVTNELAGLIEAAGLDVTVGFYHDEADGRPSLACDLVEEFRHALVDRLILLMVNRRVVTDESFHTVEGQGCRLTEAGLRQFLEAYERGLLGPRPSEGGSRRLLLQQVARLTAAVSSGAPYQSHLEGV